MTHSIDLHHSRWRDRWGHQAARLLAVSIGVAIVLGFQPHRATALTLLISVALIVFVVMTWLQMRRHDRRLCEACAAEMPLNPMQQASRFQRRFWLAHQGSRPVYLVPYLVLLVGSNFLTSSTGRYFWALMQATMIYLILANGSHRRLQPWCPWCRSDGGGSHQDFVPEPDGPRGNTLQPA